MAQHAYWTGHIRLSLITFPVRLYTAVTAVEKIRLHKYDRRTGQRIHYLNMNDEGKVVDSEDVVKGYEYEKGSFVPVEDEQLQKLRQESKHTINLVQFAEFTAVDPVYYDNHYFIAPEGEIAQEAYQTLRAALQESRTVALGQVVLSNRERVVALRPFGKGMVMETLHYDYEVASAKDYFSTIKSAIKIDDEQLDLALELIRRKMGDFDPSQFRDLYQEGLKEIISARLEKRPAHLEEERPPPGKVVNIMEALRRSLQQSGDETPKRKKSPPQRSRRKRMG
jgi:DNA end-binding protein Ku